jgi:hypothetical protein
MPISIITVGIIIVGCIGVFILFLMSRKRRPTKVACERVDAAWKRVLSVENLTLKIVEADKVLDLALSLLGYQGSVGEKLKIAGPRFSSIDSVWRAHKLRNSLVHDMHPSIGLKDVEGALSAFRKGLSDLGY